MHDEPKAAGPAGARSASPSGSHHLGAERADSPHRGPHGRTPDVTRLPVGHRSGHGVLAPGPAPGGPASAVSRRAGPGRNGPFVPGRASSRTAMVRGLHWAQPARSPTLDGDL